MDRELQTKECHMVYLINVQVSIDVSYNADNYLPKANIPLFFILMSIIKHQESRHINYL